MVYARCLHQLVLCAEGSQRAAHPIARKLLLEYLQHACRLMGCELVNAIFNTGQVTLLIDLNVDISLEVFIERLKSWTGAWIVGKETRQDYWMKSCWHTAVSPEERNVPLAERTGPLLTAGSQIADTTKVCHHIILITSRARLLIPVKYRMLMAKVAAESAQAIGADVVASWAMRNHVHLLCWTPVAESISQFIDRLKSELLERMLNNRHLRRAEGWSEDSVVFTVSPYKIAEEERIVLIQDRIHSNRVLNEMYLLYPRLGIKYVVSLN